jgi:hypothetical protein
LVTIRKSKLFAVTEVADLTIALQRIEPREIVVADVIVVVKKRSLHVLVKTELLGNLETNGHLAKLADHVKSVPQEKLVRLAMNVRHAKIVDHATNDRHVKSVRLAMNDRHVKSVRLAMNVRHVKSVDHATNDRHVKSVRLVTNGHRGKLLLEIDRIDRIDQHAGQRRVIMML